LSRKAANVDRPDFALSSLDVHAICETDGGFAARHVSTLCRALVPPAFRRSHGEHTDGSQSAGLVDFAFWFESLVLAGSAPVESLPRCGRATFPRAALEP